MQGKAGSALLLSHSQERKRKRCRLHHFAGHPHAPQLPAGVAVS